MAIPSSGFPLTAAISPRVHVIDHTDSTNADLVRAVERDPASHPHLSLILTDDQRAGRGRLDRTWTTPPGTALAVSVLVRVAGLPSHARGWIPLIAGAAMTRAVAAQVDGTSRTAALKWPNDVLVDGRKICGILAQVVPADPDAVVIGSGVNTAMTSAELPVSTATSFAAMGLRVDEDRLLADYLGALEKNLSALIASSGDAVASGVRDEVQGLCATIGAHIAVHLPDGLVREGAATRLDGDGRLVLTSSGVESVVSAGDVVHVR